MEILLSFFLGAGTQNTEVDSGVRAPIGPGHSSSVELC